MTAPSVSWNGAVVAITGASRGIGRAVAIEAAARGAQIGLIARSRQDLDGVLREIGGRGIAAPADIGDRDDLRAALDRTAAELGPIDILVANAGIGAWGPFAEIDLDEIERLTRVNYLGTAYAIRMVLPQMMERRRGHIVVVGSIAGRIGTPFEGAYAATKFAQIGLAEAVAVEAEQHGVGVSIVNPGIVDTEFFSTRGHPPPDGPPKPVTAEQVASAVLAAVDHNRFEQVVPRWLRQAVVLRHAAPPLLRWGTRRRFR